MYTLSLCIIFIFITCNKQYKNVNNILVYELFDMQHFWIFYGQMSPFLVLFDLPWNG